MIGKTDTKAEGYLSTNVPRLRRGFVKTVHQARAKNSQQPTDQLEGLEDSCLSNDGAAHHGSDGEEGHEWDKVDTADNSRLTPNGLEVDGKIEQDLKVRAIATEQDYSLAKYMSRLEIKAGGHSQPGEYQPRPCQAFFQDMEWHDGVTTLEPLNGPECNGQNNEQNHGRDHRAIGPQFR